MKIVEIDGAVPAGWRKVIVAEHQPQYQPMPALIGENIEEKPHLSRWTLTWKERWRVLLHGELWVTHLTFGRPIRSEPQSPIMLDVQRPEWTFQNIYDKIRLYE